MQHRNSQWPVEWLVLGREHRISIRVFESNCLFLAEPKRFILVALYSQDFSLQPLQISFDSDNFEPSYDVEKLEVAYAKFLQTFVAHLFAIKHLLSAAAIDFVPCCCFLLPLPSLQYRFLCSLFFLFTQLFAAANWLLTINCQLINFLKLKFKWNFDLFTPIIFWISLSSSFTSLLLSSFGSFSCCWKIL